MGDPGERLSSLHAVAVVIIALESQVAAGLALKTNKQANKQKSEQQKYVPERRD